MEPNIPSPVCRKDGVEIHAAVPKDITCLLYTSDAADE